jgi:hypothetical protein
MTSRVGRKLRQQVQGPGTLAGEHRKVHRTVLQHTEIALGPGYRSPEEFEQQSERGNSADSPGATMHFIMNDWNGENEERASTELSGEADSNAVLFPIPILLLRDASVPKEFVSLQGLMPQDCARITG